MLKKQEHRRAQGARTTPTLSRRAWLIILGILAVVIVVGGGLLWYSSYRTGNVVLKTVNGENITQRDLTRRESTIMYLFGLQNRFDAETQKSILDSMVDEKLVAVEAKKRELEVTDQELKDLSDQYAATLAAAYGSNLNITVARLRLKVTQAALDDYLRSQLHGEKIYTAITADVKVTEADIQAMYEQQKETLDKQGLSLEQARETLTQDALNQKRGDTYSQFLETLRTAATITGPGLP